MHATTVEHVSANAAAPMRMGDGVEVQNQFSPARAEKSVKKSETATFFTRFDSINIQLMSGRVIQILNGTNEINNMKQTKQVFL